MAKADWLTVYPMSGEGNATVQNSGTPHKGRVQRSTTVTAVVPGLNSGKSYQVNQKPTSEYVTLDSLSFSCPFTESKITISGKSNAQTLIFQTATGSEIEFVVPNSYTINGSLSAAVNSPIQGDPGASAEFTFSIVVTVPKNTIGTKSGKFEIKTSNSTTPSQVVNVSQAPSEWNITYSKNEFVQSIAKNSEVVIYGKNATNTAVLPDNTVQYTYSFDGWYTGSQLISSDLSLVVENITSDRNFIATGNRTLNRYTLVITVIPTGAGTTVGQGTYNYGSSVQATATPATGYNFTKWVLDTGDVSKANPLTGIDIDGNRTVQAVFTPKRYSISANAAYRVNESGDFTTGTTGGTVSRGGTYTHGDSVSLKATPATGYSFVGWYEGANQVSTAETYTFTATSARTLVGRFQRNWYTITFSAGTGGTVSPTSARVQYGGSAESTATANTGYTFTQWSDGTKTAKLTVTNVTANATYAASFGINAYVITYQAGTGVASVTPTSETVNHGSNAAGSTATVATGYNFDGWYNGATRVSTALKYGPTNVTSNMTLTAKATIKTFTITATSDNTNQGTVSPATQTVNYGGSATVTATVKTGYQFDGWYEGAARVSTSLSYALSNITANHALVAKFAAKMVTMNVKVSPTGGGTVTNGSASFQEATENPLTAVPATGYKFVKWTYASPSAPTGDETQTSTTNPQSFAWYQGRNITAHFEKLSYTVSYTKNANIASITKTSETVTYGGTATCTAALPANTAQYTYSFAGWYEGSTQISTALALSVSNITAARTFEARGTATINRYTITVTNGSGSGTYNYGTEVTLTANTITGKTFSKWSDGVTTASRKITVTGNASYTAEYTDNYYTVSYVKGTGVATISRTSESVIYNGNALGCTATVTTGYTFSGWYNGSNRVSTSLTYAPTGVTANMTLTAQATLNSYTVTPSAYYRTTDGTGNYTAGTTGGTVSGGGTVSHGSSTTVTATPATGYQFDGWFSAGPSGGSLLSSSASYSFTVTGSQTVYARFTRRYFTVTYSAGDYVGSLSRTSERVAYGGNAAGSTITPLATTAQYSYAVDGWYNGASKLTSAATYAPTGVTANMTLTAKCTRTLRQYTITYVAGDYISTVSRASENVNYGSNGAGSTATVMATTAQYTYSFDGWYEGANKIQSAATIVPTNVQANRTFTAKGTRTLRSYSIGVALDSTSAGRGTVSGGGTYNYGASVTVECTLSNSGDKFDGWYNGSTKVSSDLSYTFTCTGAVTLTAKILYIDVTPTNLSFGSGGETKSFTVKSNINWSLS
jgi:uncharacterized repeat protein (TIGR02543 family)